MQKKHLFVAAGILTVSAPSFAAGFEKSSFWSGKYSGIAGAAASSAQGAEALYWNPAGLVEDGHEGFEVSGNISPTMAKFEGPVTTPNQTVDGSTKWIPPFGAFLSYGITKDWAVGFGIYSSAGTRAEFDDVSIDPTFFTLTPTLKTSLTVTEYSLGTSYQVLPGLKIGGAWRIVHGSADLASATVVGGTTLAAADYEGLSQTRVNGWRIGAQYEPEAKNWGIGATWRTAVNFDNAAGSATLATQTAGSGTTTTQTGTASAALSFPSQISVGAHYDILPQTLRFFVQDTWTQFHNIQAITVNSSIATLPSYTTPTSWNNENALRFAFECSAVQDWKFRIGYSWGNQVQPDDVAIPTLVAPSSGQTFVLGAGTSLFAHTLDLDASLQYDVASGTGNAANAGAGAAAPGLAGDYKSYDFALNLGATYRF